MPARSSPRAQLAEEAVLEPHRHAPPAPPSSPLTLEVTLNARDAAVVLALAEDDYRTPAQQVGWIVAQWMKLHATTHRTPATPAPASSPANSSNGHSAAQPSSAQPVAIPVYHVGDGSAGSGCGRVGLFFRRPIGPGDTIQPGDVLLLDGSPLASGGLVCGHCGAPFTMAPRNWRAGSEEE